MEHSKEFQKLLQEFSNLSYIKPQALPDIDLYMDQVTTFMDEKLEHSKRYPEDKILTKTMINNYTKNNLLPPTEKKKYTREHLLVLIFIYYLKNILSINDIQTLMAPLKDRYFARTEGTNMKDIYRHIISLELDMFRPFTKDILRKMQLAEEAFPEEPEEDREYLRNFSLVCMLAFDVYLKKQMIETIVDDLREKEEASSKTEKDKEKSSRRKKES